MLPVVMGLVLTFLVALVWRLVACAGMGEGLDGGSVSGDHMNTRSYDGGGTL